MDNQNCRLVPLPLSGAMRLLMAAWCCLTFATFTHAQVVPGTSGHNWVDTRLDIRPGTLVQLSATGQVDVGWGWGVHGPEGTSTFSNGSGYPSNTKSLVRYGLVARLTTSRTSPQGGVLQDWSYGERRQLCAAQGGHLWLTVNDDDPGNNIGAFFVRVSQTPCQPPVERGRFRVTITGFKVVHPTLDDILQRDGKGDEVFFLSRVKLIEGDRIISLQDLQSRVMGDSDGFPGRVREGTMPPGPFGGTVGGLRMGDVVPRDGLPRVPTMDRAPMQIFNGELTANQVLVVEPTIWEHDGPDDFLTSVGRLFNPVIDNGSRSVVPLPDPEHPGLLGRILGTGGEVGTNRRVGLNVFGDPRPRPIGMRLDRQSYVFVPQHLCFSFADANEASRTNFGEGNGVIRITYQDTDALQGIYDLFVKIERL